jgi:hypothetical protein
MQNAPVVSEQSSINNEQTPLVFTSGDLERLFGTKGHPGHGLDKDTWKDHVNKGTTEQGYWQWVEGGVSIAKEIEE